MWYNGRCQRKTHLVSLTREQRMHRLPVAAHRVAATNLIAMLAALPAAAQRGAPRPLGNPIHVAPTALARVAPDGQLTSPWHVLGEGGTARTVCNALLCFDAFEPDGNVPGFPNECYPGFDCGMGSHRWWFGTAYTLGTFAANDMQSGCVDCWGAVAQRLEFAWHWGPCPDHGGVSRCLVGVWTTENWADCQAPAYAGSTYSGVLYDFGTLECNANGYYFADIYDLADHRDALLALEGFKDTSVNNLLAAVDASRDPSALDLDQVAADARAAFGDEADAEIVEVLAHATGSAQTG